VPPIAHADKSRIRTRNVHASPKRCLANSNKDLFTPSPFARRSTIRISDNFLVHRELKEGTKVHGVRRYLLLPRTDNDDVRYYEESPPEEGNVIASLNANRNILFGARLHVESPPTSTTDDDGEYHEYVARYLSACGYLLDLAREDAARNGQQVQALATLNGLCSWVAECLDKDGEGSEVLTGLMHGGQRPNPLMISKKEKKAPKGKRSQKIGNPSAALVLDKEADRMSMLEAVRAIATGEPRPGHSVVGAGTYRDGKKGWLALAREYSRLAATDSVSLDASYVGRRGLEELALYMSRDGEVTKIEHLGHTDPGYLREAGGAMARLFFC